MRISDWSSDVCSSDLQYPDEAEPEGGQASRVEALAEEQHGEQAGPQRRGELDGRYRGQRQQRDAEDPQHLPGEVEDVAQQVAGQIGRASGRDRVWQYV